MATRYGIYLSSTLRDLEAERKAVKDYLTDQGFSVKQSYSASEDDLTKSCLDDVAQCRVYVGIIGMRYGYTPEGGGGKSITEMEFERARAENIPCFVFTKAKDAKTYAPDDLDTNTRENGNGKAISSFRDRLGSGKEVRPDSFVAADDLKLKVAGKIADFRRLIEGTSDLLQARKRNSAELAYDVGLIFVPGTDDTLYGRIHNAASDSRFKLLSISPDDASYAGRVDADTRACRCACWALTPQSLARFKAAPGVLEAALRIHRFRFGATFALLAEGANQGQLDTAWAFDATVEAAPDHTEAEWLDRLYAGVRAKALQIRPDRRISIPMMIIALTDDDAKKMVADPVAVMQAYTTSDQRLIRRQQFENLRTAISIRIKNWPHGFYGETREAWRPYGGGHPTAVELLDRAVARVNDADKRTGRERLLLAGEDIRLQTRRYRFDEYLEDAYGSRDNLDRIRDLGCLVLVDELSLLHPALRQRANDFLSGQRVAVMSVNPCDPAPLPVSDMLSELSHLSVGALRDRFRVAQDPRCELAVNSVERMERWLRLVLPELVPALGQSEPQEELRNKVFAD
jgi:hypothetical protein